MTSTKPDVLVVAPVFGPTLAAIEAQYTAHKLWLAPTPAELLAQVGPRTEAAVTTGGRGMDAAMMGQLPWLKIIACFGVGVDAIDLAAAKTRSIRVTNTPDVLTEDVADLALGLLLAAVRRIAQGDRFVREGRWLQGNMELTKTLQGGTLGIVGLGRIGQAIAKRGLAFGMKIAYHGPRPKEVPFRYYADPVELARDCEFLIAACPGGDSTRGIVSKAVIEALGPKGIFVNISRGSVVDEPALVAALQAGKLGGAGLDVFADEPRVPSALLSMDNVVLQPHQGSATFRTREAMGQLVLDNLAAWFSGRPLVTPVV
jgi:lactate dehydrogenase-like 2-hydroxyacid dehydrogenase